MHGLIRASIGIGLCAALTATWTGFTVASQTATVTYTVVGTDDKPVPNAVVRFTPESGAVPVAPGEETVVNQYRQSFDPFITILPTGTSVRFQNSDPFGHHVYSFSKAKQFEFRQPTRGTTDALVLDQPGLIALGCNIHDHMLAYIFVSDSPNVALSDGDGMAELTGIAPGTYTATIWHPRLKGPSVEKTVVVSVDGTAETVELDLKPPRRVRKSSYSGDR